MTTQEIDEKVDSFLWNLARNVSLNSRTDGKFIRRQEKRLVKRLKNLFDQQVEWIVKRAESLSFFKDEETNAPNNDDEISSMFEGLPYRVAIAETIVGFMRVTMNKGGKTMVRTLDLGEFGISFDLTNAEALNFLGGKLSHELSQERGNINQTTVERISQILLEAAESGQSYQKTAQLIREQGGRGVFSQARAELIATREIGVAYEEGKEIPIREFKRKHPGRIVEKAWQTVNDEKVTPTHTANQNKGWILFEERFPSPPNGTGDKKAPASDQPRCRCFTKYRILPPSNQ